MLNTRTTLVSISLLAVLLLALSFVTSRTDVGSGSASDQLVSNKNGSVPVSLDTAPIRSYRDRSDQCFDVSVRDLNACRAEVQAPAPSRLLKVDECFDVSISELASCRSTSQAPAP